MPFKTGWLTTTKATIELWKVCRDLGFKFLRTRSLNQDPIENQCSATRMVIPLEGLLNMLVKVPK